MQSIAPDNVFFCLFFYLFFFCLFLIFILFLHKNIHCGYSLEAPHRGTSNEYNNIYFYGEIRKILAEWPLLFGAIAVTDQAMKNEIYGSYYHLIAPDKGIGEVTI